MASVPTISSGAIAKLLSTLTELGVDPAPIFAEAALDPAVCDDTDARVPLATLHALWEAVLHRWPRDDAALVGALRYRPGDYLLVGFVCMNSATLGEALGHVVRYLGLWTDDPGMRLHEDATLEVVYRTRFADRPGLRCATEASLAEILQAARLVTQTDLAPREVCFTHPAPADVAAHEAFFRAPVRFGQPATLMRLRAEQLAMPLPSADPQLGQFLRGLANEALARRSEAPGSFVEELRSAIAEELQRGVPTLGQLARRMALGERTLRRRLEQEGTRFRDVLDQTRAELAESYVRDRRLPLSEVAFLLGFSEPSAFHRAFRRWTGTTPAAFRQG